MKINDERLQKQGLKAGDIIPFAKHNWRVLDVQAGKALILTEGITEKRASFDITWETCTLRKYLNGKFLQRFTQEEQSRIIETRTANPDNLWYGTPGGRDTDDKIFLLSIEEADRYFGNSGDYQGERPKKYYYKNDKCVADSEGDCFSNVHDNARVAEYKGEACWWWLRSPGDRTPPYGNLAARVSTDGRVSAYGFLVFDFRGGVRPALWLHL